MRLLVLERRSSARFCVDVELGLRAEERDGVHAKDVRAELSADDEPE